MFLIFVAAVALYVCAAAVSDFRFQRIPNYITVPAAVIGLVFNLIAGMYGYPNYCGLNGLLASLAGFAFGMALLFVPWMMSGGGAGDVKFLAALGTWLGPWYLFIAFLVGMILAVFAGLYKWAMIASVQGPWKAKEALGAGAIAASKPGEKKRSKKTRIALVVPLAVSCLLLLGMLAVQNFAGQPPTPPLWFMRP